METVSDIMVGIEELLGVKLDWEQRYYTVIIDRDDLEIIYDALHKQRSK